MAPVMVSLPGAGGTEPTILEVLNANIINSASTTESHPQSQPANERTDGSDQISDKDTGEFVTAAESKSASNKVEDSTGPDLGAPVTSAEGKEAVASDITDSENVLEIESHLIETFENYSVSEQSDTGGVEVDEVPPAEEELSKSSRLESEDSPKTVIEVKPSVPKVLKPVETALDIKAQEPKIDFTERLVIPEEKQDLPEVEEDNSHIEDLEDNHSNIEQSQEIEAELKNEFSNSSETNKSISKTTESVSDLKEAGRGESNVNLNVNFDEHVSKTQVEEELSDQIGTEPETDISENLSCKEGKEKQHDPSPEIETKEIFDANLTAALQPKIKSDAENITKQEIEDKTENLKEVPTSIQSIAQTEEKDETAVSDNLLTDHKDKPEITNEEIKQTSQKCNGIITSQTNEDLNLQSTKIDVPVGINGLPISASKSEEEAKKSFLESLPQLDETESKLLSDEARQACYQSLREYLKREKDRPPVPLQTYRWEDLRRAKQQGGYPWTHLYKRPLGPDEEPEIVLLLRKSQELQRLPSESPKSLKKVRIHEQVLVKETERYISDLSDAEDIAEDNRSVQSDSPKASTPEPEVKKIKSKKLRGILKRQRPLFEKLDLSFTKHSSEPDSGKSEDSPKKLKCCPPIMEKLKTMADKQLKRRHIKKIPLKADEKIVLSEEQKILKLKLSPKAERSEIPHFVEKQDSDEILEIVELDESPSKTRKRREELLAEHSTASVLVPDEIIEIPEALRAEEDQKTEEPSQPTPEPTVSEILEEELKSTPPEKAPRKRKDHVYEDIDSDTLETKIDEILEEAVVGALKKSLATQDETILKDLDVKTKLEEMGSSEEDQDRPPMTRLAPLSSIDSASSEEERKPPLPALVEESEQMSHDDILEEKEPSEELKIVEGHQQGEQQEEKDPELKSALKREPSPPSDKKVTFSHVEDEAEPHREDIELPEHIRMEQSRWSKVSDHEYEPIGQPVGEQVQLKPSQQKESSAAPQVIPTVEVSQSTEVEQPKTTEPAAEKMPPIQPMETEAKPVETTAEDVQRDIEERYFSSSTTTPRTESRTDNEIHTSQVDSSALEELPLQRESRKKGFMASAQDKSRKMQANLRSQAGKIRTKIRGLKKPSSGSPKSKEKKRFKTPNFSKLKMPEIKRPELPKFKTPEMPKFKSPDMSKFKAPEFKKIEFKRPEFTKFSKPDMSKFKIPEKFSSLKLKRSKSLKEETSPETTSGTSPESAATPVKKKFEFNFGTYPRVLRKKKERLGAQVIARADDLPSTETPPSLESATIPKGSRDKGPVGSKWIDKFSDVSYGDSESGKYQRYESEPESLERMERDSLERRMKESLDRSNEEEEDLGTVQTVEQKQFAEYDEENRAIHEISKSREGEFKKRRPIVHQDSDLVSEESKDVGWTDKDILRNKILLRSDAEVEAENYPSEEGLSGSVTNTNQETQSTGSSTAKKGVLEEIDDDEFFLRKRGISQDNIEIRQYISTAIREGLSTPVNTLAQLGDSQGYYPDETDISNDQVNYGYDIPPPKPRRAKHGYNVDSAEISQEFDVEQKENYDDNISLPQTGSDYFQSLPPSRPLRKSKTQYSEDSQEIGPDDIPYFDEEGRLYYKKDQTNEIDKPQVKLTYQENEDFDQNEFEEPPKAPKRRKKQLPQSIEKDSYINGFGGRSISNTFLPNGDQIEKVIVYRTEHEYIIPLAKAETFGTPTPPTRRSRSRSRATDDDRTSHGADSLILDSHAIAEDDKFFVDMKENDGYAVVRKDPPPRPPPPMRRKRSPNLLDGQKFSTMPHLRKEEAPPERPTRNYSTIGPSRPPRRKSSASIEDTTRQYEVLDIEDERPESPRDLHSGDVINKMKHRPLPPPPRPPREKKQKSAEDKDDRDGGGEKIIFDIQENGDYEIEKPVEKCIEVEVSTQTDPLPDDFVCEEFEITEDMRIIEPRRPKTLEDILQEEQQAEMERAKQLTEEDNLSKSIQKFREAGQRSYSERSRGSTAERSRTSLSRPTTPSAVIIERRVPTPIPYKENETMLEASLTVQPLADLDLEDELEQEYAASEDKYEEKPTNIDLKRQKEEEEERLIQKYIQDLIVAEKESEVSEPEISQSGISHELLQPEIPEPEMEEDEKFKEDAPPEKEPQELPPQPPPRKRSSIPTVEDQSAVIPIEMSKESALTPLKEHPPVETVQEASTTKLAVADLEVERLNVHALQAGRILVSELQGASVTADELECKSGNLVVHKIEFPPGFIEEIIERVRGSDVEQSKPQTTETVEARLSSTQPEEAPARPPPPQQPIFPSEYMQYSMPPPSFYQLRSPSDEEHQPSIQHYRRRRHHRRRDSSSEDSYRERRRSRQGTRSPEPTIGQLGGQLLRACGTSVLRTMNQIINYLQTAQKEGNERNISTAIVLLVLVALGFLIVGMSSKNIHHHHWDFFNPPGNEGRNQ